MKILLDTHAALWWWVDSPSLGGNARDAISDPGNQVHFSAASGYEIFQKVRLGRLGILAVLQANLPAAVVTKLNAEIVKAAQLPDIRERFASEGAIVVAGTPQQAIAHI